MEVKMNNCSKCKHGGYGCDLEQLPDSCGDLFVEVDSVSDGSVYKVVFFECPRCGESHQEQEGCGGVDNSGEPFEFGCGTCGFDFNVEY